MRADESMLEVNEGDENEIEENMVGMTHETLSPASRPDPSNNFS